MPKISSFSEISPNAELADDVEIGPFCVVGPDVRLQPGNRLISHVYLGGHATIGSGNVFYPHCVVGIDPQDKKFHGEVTYLEIGDHNQIREGVSIHPGTGVGGGNTRIGSRNLIMGNCHVAHDVQMGSDCILANAVNLAGHCVLGDRVWLNGMIGVHPFVTFGDLCYVAGLGRITKDIPPYVKVDQHGRERALNTEGLRRASFAPADVKALSSAFRKLYRREEPLSVTLTEFTSGMDLNPHVRKLIDFLERRTHGVSGRYVESLRTPQSRAGDQAMNPGRTHLPFSLLRYSGGGSGWGRFSSVRATQTPTPALPRSTGGGGEVSNAFALAMNRSVLCVYAAVALLVFCSVASADWHDQLLAGRAAIRQGDYPAAEPLLQDAVHQAAPDSADSAEALNELGKLDRLTAQYDHAETLDEQAEQIAEKVKAAGDPLVADILENRGELDTTRGICPRAEQELKLALSIRDKTFGETSAPAAESMTNLGLLDLIESRFDDGEKLCLLAVDIQGRVLQPDDPALADGWDNLSNVYLLRSRLPEAEDLAKKSLDLRINVLGETHPDVGESYDNLAWVYVTWGDAVRARRLFQLAHFIRVNTLGENHPDTMESWAMEAQEMDIEHAPADRTCRMMQDALAVELKVLGPRHWVTQTVQMGLADVYQEMNRDSDAERILTSALEASRQEFGEDDPNTANLESSLADYYAGPGNQPAQADLYYKKSLTTTEKFFGSDDRGVGFLLARYADFLNTTGQTGEATTFMERARQIESADAARNPLSKLEGPGL